MSTTFNFPPNPTLNQQVTLPNGSIAQWNGTEWVSVGDSTVTYPLPITAGGTGATTAGQARINLGLNTATGEFIVQKDGTVAAPGIAFASEPGMGLYRSAAGVIRFAASGADSAVIDAAGAANTTVTVAPRTAAGTSVISLSNQPTGSTNRNNTQLIQNPDGSSILRNLPMGTAVRGGMTIDAASVNMATTAVSQQGGAGQTNTFSMLTSGANASNLISLNRSSGGTGINGIDFNFDGTLRWRFTHNGGDGSFSLYRLNAAGVYVNTPLAFDWTTGKITMQTAGLGHAVQIADFGGSGCGLLLSAAGGDKMIRVESNNFRILNNAQTSYIFTVTDVGQVQAVTGYQSRGGVGGGTSTNSFNFYWGDAGLGNGLNAYVDASLIGRIAYAATPSDERLKRDITPLVSSEEAFMAVNPISFRWANHEDVPTAFSEDEVQEGFSAQNVHPNFPAAIDGDFDAVNDLNGGASFVSLKDRAILAHMYVRVKDLIKRVRELEKS